MKRPAVIAGAAIGLLLLAYAGCYLRLRLNLDLVHRATTGGHSVVANGERGPLLFVGSMLPGAADLESVLEHEERASRRAFVFFAPARWLECRWWDLVDPDPGSAFRTTP